ncbi:hypothetical protein A2164_01400 [Candidatus Curtissbacteria bacterium RBG_13_35_7]|uniref:Uncharacterized protein n=1 Tax=Candidatus Curtissbacteria bacterium RBG_13_35_7 TaxID=1797705 RepID=A0A1F5G4V9_9BACT|nr:MAG: hypothetical protein A2164_01400 [Candidatus Curtissbacteria bacterium RBG_13_35_7]
MSIIYGVNTEERFTPKDVRDAIILCFTQAHKKALDDTLKDSASDMTMAEFEELKKINILQMIHNYFEEIDGDYENPTKESLIAICDKLAE